MCGHGDMVAETNMRRISKPDCCLDCERMFLLGTCPNHNVERLAFTVCDSYSPLMGDALIGGVSGCRCSLGVVAMGFTRMGAE